MKEENGMSVKCFSYLVESFIYSSKCVESYYAEYSDAMIINELQKYRDFVLKNIDEIRGEIKCANNKLNVSIETFNELPTEELYKQLVLYMDQVIIPDPIFEMTELPTSLSDSMGEFMGLKKKEDFNRGKLVDFISYIKFINPLITAGFVVMMPVSLMHEAPKELNINYSPTAYADVLPQNIGDFYRSIAKVYNLTKSEFGLRVHLEEALRLGAKIYVDFPDDHRMNGHVYQYSSMQMVDYDEKTNTGLLKCWEPDSISQIEFDCWVNQSINQAAIQHFGEKYSELILAHRCGCMYLAQSSLTAKILQMVIEKPTKESELASMAMHIDLPVLHQLSITDILNIRQNYGEAFYNFRNELNSKLIGIDSETDSSAFKRQLETIEYELNNIQVIEVQKEYRKIVRTLKLDALACTGSLIASFTTGGITAVGAATAFVKGISDVGKYYTDVKEHNGLFLWKLNNQASKYEI